MAGRPRLLLFAYSCSPAHGSEPGAAWGTVDAVSRFADTVVLVSPEHMSAIRAREAAVAVPGRRFVEVPFPFGSAAVGWAARLHRQSDFIRYLGWLRIALEQARCLHVAEPFDAAMHVSYGSYWLPSPVTELGIPSIWGPVGGATETPRRLWPFLGWRGVVGEIEKRIAVRSAALLPASRRACREATVRLAETAATRDRLPAAVRDDVILAQRAALQEVPPLELPAQREPFLLFGYSLHGRKGPRLAVRALARTPGSARLVFAADGYERRALGRLARRLGIGDRVEFRAGLSRDEMLALMVRATAVVFPGLREEGGCTLVEAMKLGTPVIVLGHGGARMLAEFSTDPSRTAIVEPEDAERTVAAMAAAMSRFLDDPPTATSPYIDVEPTIHALRRAIEEAVGPLTSEATVADVGQRT